MGPYEGAPFFASVSTQPASVLPVNNVGQLEVHELPDQNVPVLLLRAFDGTIRWARLLQPERRNEDGSVVTAQVRELRLHSIKPDSAGHRVRLHCNWEWGGLEGGLIFLNPDFTFRAFALGS